MIEIQLYRQRIGIFSGGKHHSKRHFLNKNHKQGDKYLSNYFLGMTVLVSLLVVLTAGLNLQHLNVKITSS